MTVKRGRPLRMLLIAGVLLTVAAYGWLWPEIRIALVDDPVARVQIGMTRAQVHAIIGRPPDLENEIDGRALTDVWSSAGEDFHVHYSDGRAFSFWRGDNPIRWITRKVRNLFKR
jgi:hypothetical protein